MDYSDKVTDAFLQQYGSENLAGAQKMNKRYDVAKTLLTTEYPDLISELEERAGEQYVVDEAKWNLILDDISLAEDVSE